MFVLALRLPADLTHTSKLLEAPSAPQDQTQTRSNFSVSLVAGRPALEKYSSKQVNTYEEACSQALRYW